MRSSASRRLSGHTIHGEVALRGDSKGVGHPVEKCKHRRDINRLRNLRLCPAEIAQSLHIFLRRTVRGFGDLLYVIEKGVFRRAQPRLIQVAVGNRLYGGLFCSLNTQEVSVRVQSIRAAIQIRDVACNGFFCLAVEVAF